MIIAKNNQAVIVFDFAGLCMTFLRNADGSICLGNGESATETLEVLRQKIDSEYHELCETVSKATIMMNVMGKIVHNLDTEESDIKLMVKRTQSKYAELVKIKEAASVTAAEVRDLLTLAKKFDKTANLADELNGCGECEGCKATAAGEGMPDGLSKMIETFRNILAGGGEGPSNLHDFGPRDQANEPSAEESLLSKLPEGTRILSQEELPPHLHNLQQILADRFGGNMKVVFGTIPLPQEFRKSEDGPTFH